MRYFSCIYYFNENKKSHRLHASANILLGDCEVTSRWQKDFLDKTFKKRSKTKRKKHHHRILHIRISLGSKFQLQQRTFIFQTNLP